MEAAVEKTALSPNWRISEAYMEAELQILTDRFGAEHAKKFRSLLSSTRALKPTGPPIRPWRLCPQPEYHAFRAGAQIPFSSINYGMDTTPEGRMVIKNVLLATEAGLGNGKPPSSPSTSLKLRTASTIIPESQTMTCSSWLAGSAPSACSPISPLLTPPITCSTTSRAIRKPRSPIWAAAPGSWPTPRSRQRDRQRQGKPELYLCEPAPDRYPQQP